MILYSEDKTVTAPRYGGGEGFIVRYKGEYNQRNLEVLEQEEKGVEQTWL